MDPKKIWANFAVDDLDRTTQFYTQLGFRSNGRSKQLTSFFFGEDDFIIHFFLREELSKNFRGEIIDPQKGNEIMFTISAKSQKQADEWAKEIEKSEGKIISQPEEFGKGYYGFVFADPDGHRFNVFYMDGME